MAGYSVAHARPVGELYRSSYSTAQAAGDGVRITLSLTEVPELAEIPWEYLFDKPNFLAISTSTPIVRYLDVAKPRRPLEVALPIRILAVISAPTDADGLDTGDERQRLESSLKPLIDANAVSIDWLEEATLLALTKKLRPDTYHILHFIGHGGFDDASGEGALLFEDDAGRGRPISGEQLATVLNNKTSLRLVFLNSCEGARTSVKDPFSGVAASLIQREIPAVIAMQFEITDRAAIIFAGEFYAMLAEGQPVDTAVTQARLTVFADQNDVEWGTLSCSCESPTASCSASPMRALPRVAVEDLPENGGGSAACDARRDERIVDAGPLAGDTTGRTDARSRSRRRAPATTPAPPPPPTPTPTPTRRRPTPTPIPTPTPNPADADLADAVADRRRGCRRASDRSRPPARVLPSGTTGSLRCRPSARRRPVRSPCRERTSRLPSRSTSRSMAPSSRR